MRSHPLSLEDHNLIESSCFGCKTFKFQFSQDHQNGKSFTQSIISEQAFIEDACIFDNYNPYDEDENSKLAKISWIYWHVFLWCPHWPTQNSAEPMRWILGPFCDLPSTCLPAKPRHLGWKNGLDREKVHCGVQMLPPPSCGKNNDHTITIAAESQSHSPSLLAELQSNEDQIVAKQLWKASAMLRQHLQERRRRKQACKLWSSASLKLWLTDWQG